MLNRIGCFTGVIAATLAIWISNAAAETLKVAVAQRGFWNSSFIEFALQQGFFKQEGLDIEILYTEGGASTLTPLVAGSIDIAMTNGTLGVIAAFAKGMPVKIISAEATGAPDAFWYCAIRRAGSRASGDTNGKTDVFSSPGSSTNLIILQLINQEKREPKLVAIPAGRARYAGHDQPDRCRLVGSASRAEGSHRRPPADHRPRQQR